MKQALLIIVIAMAALLPVGPGCRPRQDPAAVSIAAAADLRYGLDELVGEFRTEHPEVNISVTYGSSGNFYAQLLRGAPFDLFLSADVAYPRQLANRGLIVPESEFSYAEGRIVVWTLASSSPFSVEALGLQALADPSVTRIAIANPEHAPYGRAAEAAMRKAGLLDLVRPKLVFGENVSQTLQFVQSGSAEVGIVALSLALAPRVAAEGRYWLVPSDLHPRIEQGGAIMRSARNLEVARAFRAFLLNPEGRALLQRYGFSTSNLEFRAPEVGVRTPDLTPGPAATGP